MDGEPFTAGGGEIDQKLFRAIRPVISLVERKGDRDGTAGRDTHRRRWGERVAGAGAGSYPWKGRPFD